MPTRHASAVWRGTLKEGRGNMNLESGAFSGEYSFSSRFEEGTGTNPEELIGGAHAGCFSMAFSLELSEAGYDPEIIETKANVTLEKAEGGFKISKILLETEAKVPNIEDDFFQKIANDAKVGCPVSKALGGVNIEVKASLKK